MEVESHMPRLHTITYNYIQLYIQLHTITYNYIQLHTITYNYIQLHTITQKGHVLSPESPKVSVQQVPNFLPVRNWFWIFMSPTRANHQVQL